MDWRITSDKTMSSFWLNHYLRYHLFFLLFHAFLSPFLGKHIAMFHYPKSLDLLSLPPRNPPRNQTPSACINTHTQTYIYKEFAGKHAWIIYWERDRPKNLPVTNQSMHSVNEILLFISHVDVLPLDATHLFWFLLLASLRGCHHLPHPSLIHSN